MLARLALLFIAVPLIELLLLLQLAEVTGAAVTWALVIVTGLLGALLIRRQGLRTYQRVRSELAAGRLPTDALIDGVLIVAAGALLLTPGLITDAVAISLLVPVSRRWYRAAAGRWIRSHLAISSFSINPGQPPSSSKVIDSYVVRDASDDDSSR